MLCENVAHARELVRPIRHMRVALPFAPRPRTCPRTRTKACIPILGHAAHRARAPAILTYHCCPVAAVSLALCGVSFISVPFARR